MNRLIAATKNISHPSAWLLCGMLLVTFPHIFHQHPSVTIAVSTLLLWRFLHDIKLLALPPGWLRTIIALTAFAAVGFGYHTVLGRQAGITLLVIMLFVKLLEMKSERDWHIVIALGYFVVITSFLFSQSLLAGIYTGAVVFCLTAAHVAYQRQKAHENSVSVNSKLALSLMWQALPITLVLFFLFPRASAPLWGIPNDDLVAKSGLSDSMSPGMISELSLDNSAAFRVRFDGTSPNSEELYWRGPVFTFFDGLAWQSFRFRDHKNDRISTLDPESPGNPANTAYNYSYEVTLEPHGKNWLFLLDRPTLIPDDAYLTNNQETMSLESIKNIKHYNAISNTRASLEAKHIRNRRMFLQLPGTKATRARKLAAELSEDLDHNQAYETQLVNKVLDYFRTQPFFYTRKPPLMIKDTVDQFLFDARRGFCEHYATAFTVLMRAAGIPARVVTGYHGGELNHLGDYMLVRQSDAHAWSEVWIEEQGWVRIDPTAVIPPQRIEQSDILNRLRPEAVSSQHESAWWASVLENVQFGWDNINYAWKQWVVDYTHDKQFIVLDKVGMDALNWQQIFFTLICAIVATMVLISLYYILSIGGKRSTDKAQLVYERYCKKISALGLNRLPAESARSFSQRIAEHYPQLRLTSELVAHLYNSTRYSKNNRQENLGKLTRVVQELKCRAPG